VELAVEKNGELETDIFEHGTPAYHRFGYGSSYTTPTGSTIIGGGQLPPPIDLGEEKAEPQKV
jgi:hypothetical protein